jgi:hypothetical protein
MGDYFTNPAAHPEDAGVQYIRRTFTFDLAQLQAGAGLPLGAIPAGAMISGADVNIETAFNAGTTNVMNIGSAATPAGVAASAGIIAGTPGWKKGLTGALCGTPLAADTIIYVLYAPTGTAPTTGKGQAVVTYFPKREGVGQAWPNN